MTLTEALHYCIASQLRLEFRHGRRPDLILLVAYQGDNYFMRDFPLEDFMRNPEQARERRCQHEQL